MNDRPVPQPNRSVRGIGTDAETRCVHYHSPLDIVAIRMKCCGQWYACKDCHEALADHPIAAWPEAEWEEPAVLCGACGKQMTIREYLQSCKRCLDCGADFNPACRDHHAIYFEVPCAAR